MVERDYSRLTRLRQQARALLWAEALTIALSPAFAVLGLFTILVLLGTSNSWLFSAAFILAASLAVRGLRGISPPTAAAIDRRIETASGLQHQPLATLQDEPENDSPAVRQLWQAHQQRAAASLSHATAGTLTLHTTQRDQFALRGLLLLGLITSAIIAGPAAPARLSNAITLPNWPFSGPHVTAWITPPSYAGASPHILLPGEAITTLIGAKLTVITDGPTHAPKIHIGNDAVTSTNLSDTSHRADATITASAALTIGPWWHRLAQWHVTAIPPAAPQIQITEASLAQPNILKLRWHSTDPYGLASLTASFQPVNHPNAVTLSFPLPLKTGGGAIYIDLSKSPFATAPVTLTLNASNIADATASTAYPTPIIAPGLALHDPTAIALAKLRLTIASDPTTTLTTAIRLKQISLKPPSKISPAADIQISALATSIHFGTTNTGGIIARLLALELEIEAGPDYIPAQRFAASNQALLSALAHGLNGQAPNNATLKKLLDALHQAAAAHLSALQTAAGQPTGQPMNLSTLDQMAQKIADDEAAGRTEQAAAELKSLEQILSALQNARPMTAAELAQSQAASAAANAIAQMTQAEAALLDSTQNQTATAPDQTAIKSTLDATRQNLSKNGINLPGLAPAGTSMQTATQALSQNNNGNAATAETQAIKNLQTAAAALAKAAKQQFSIGPDGTTILNPDGTDGANGAPDEQSNPNFNPSQTNPAAAIQQQIIKQDAQPALPTPTHEYFHKLLDQGP